MITTAVIFNRKNIKTDKPCPIEIRVIYNRNTFYINTGVRVCARNFVCGSIVDLADAPLLNKRVNIIFKRVQEEVNRCMEYGVLPNAKELKQKAWLAAEEIDADAAPLINWIEDEIPYLRVGVGTKKRYSTLVSRLRKYGKLKKFSDLTTENIYKWDAWLHGLRVVNQITKAEGAYISDGAVYNYHKCLKAMLSRAVEFEKIPVNPYDKLRGKFKRGERESVDYLTDEEIQNFCNINPAVGSQMALAHDLFIFQLYTGLSYSDTQKFDIKEYKNIKGKWQSVGERIKTGVPYVSQLLPPAVEILKKYGWETPKIDNAKYNLCLKALGMVAGISTPLHSHLARHTFATMMLRYGAKIENVSRMLGHTNIKQTQRYAKVLAQSVHEDFDLVSKKIKARKD